MTTQCKDVLWPLACFQLSITGCRMLWLIERRIDSSCYYSGVFFIRGKCLGGPECIPLCYFYLLPDAQHLLLQPNAVSLRYILGQLYYELFKHHGVSGSYRFSQSIDVPDSGANPPLAITELTWPLESPSSFPTRCSLAQWRGWVICQDSGILPRVAVGAAKSIRRV